MKLLTEAEVRQSLPAWAALDASREAFLSLHAQTAVIPQRALVSTPQDSITLFKPGYIPGQALGLKVIGVRPSNAASGWPTTPAVVLLFSEDNGLPVACMPATYLTALRTAAGSALASDICAAPTCRTLVVFGAGLQAEAHILTHLCVRDFTKIFVVNRNVERALRFVEAVKEEFSRLSQRDRALKCSRMRTKEAPEFVVVGLDDPAAVAKAVGEADVVCTTTAAPTPLFDGKLLKRGCHVNAVGSYQGHTREVDTDTVARASVIIDTEEALSSGDLSVPIAEGRCAEDSHIKGTLGKLLAERDAVVGSFDKEITLFKSVGTAAQDLTTATAVLRGCETDNVGFEFEMFPKAA